MCTGVSLITTRQGPRFNRQSLDLRQQPEHRQYNRRNLQNAIKNCVNLVTSHVQLLHCSRKHRPICEFRDYRNGAAQSLLYRNMTPRPWAMDARRCNATCCPHLQWSPLLGRYDLKMRARRCLETSGSNYQWTRDVTSQKNEIPTSRPNDRNSLMAYRDITGSFKWDSRLQTIVQRLP